MDDTSFQFQALLNHISENLGSDELKAMKFLCRDLLNSNRLGKADSGHKLFSSLQEQGLLDVNDNFIVAELLYRIKQFKLLKKMNYDRHQICKELKVPGKARISSYRQLLFEVSEDITMKDLETVKLFLHNHLSKSKLESITTMLDAFIEMEKEELLEEDNMELLKDICKQLGEYLVKKFDHYRQEVSQDQQAPVSDSHSNITIQDMREQDGNTFPSQSITMNSQLQSLGRYKMESNPRGYCVIINNSNFKEMPERRGTNVDAERLERVFRWLTFQVIRFENLTAEEMREKMNCYREKDHTSHDCFICCILTHGERGVMCGTDGEQIPIQEITSLFSASQCHSLRQKPKLFFIQACQGSKKQDGVGIESSRVETESSRVETESSRVETESSRVGSESSRVGAEPSSVGAEPSSVGAEPSSVGTEPSRVETEPSRVETVPSSVETEPSRVETVPSSVETEPSSVGTEPSSVGTEPSSVGTEPSSVGTEPSSIGTEPSSVSPMLESDAVSSTSATIPDEADFLLGMATVEGYVSFRHIQQGTWYIQSLCENLEKHCPSEDLLSILTIVNRDVSVKKDKKDKTQMPQPRYTLREKLYFPVTQSFSNFINCS
ncbi:caspase-8-like isoform X2 [Heterodontus francisci]